MEIKVIKFFNALECILCLHRTISSSTYTLRVLRLLHMFLELSLMLTNGVIRYINMALYDDKIVTMQVFVNVLNSLALVILAVYKSRKYNHMIRYFNINHLHLKADSQYNKNLKNISILVLASSSATLVYRFVALWFYIDVTTGVNLSVDCILYVNLVVCDVRYFCEFFALFFILNVMSEQLTSLTRSVQEFEVVKNGTIPATECKKNLKVFDKWCDVYTNVKESSKLFNTIYGLQLTMIISTIVLYYIVFLYSLTSLSFEGEIDLVLRVFYVLFMTMLLVILTLLSFAAQRTQNRAEILKRQLSKLLIHSLANEEYYKSTKGLLRLVSSRPIRTAAFGSISVDMSLLPTCVIFFTYYAVIALQFNKVL